MTSDVPTSKDAEPQGEGEEEEEEETDIKTVIQLYRKMEARVKTLEEEGRRAREEIDGLRDKLEEQEWARKRLEDKLAEINGTPATAPRGSEAGERAPVEWKKELEKVENRVIKIEEREKEKNKKRCIVFTDSNGRDATTPDSVKRFIPEEERDRYEIQIVITYRVQEAIDKVRAGQLAIRGAHILIDCLNNDARPTHKEPQLSPEKLAEGLDTLRTELWQRGAIHIVVSSLRPTQRADVGEHNKAIHRYLGTKRDEDGGHGCSTQVRLHHLRADGLHLHPRFYSVLQQTFAFALMGKYVPDPTPFDCYEPDHVRQPFLRDWPVVGLNGRQADRASSNNYGWKR